MVPTSSGPSQWGFVSIPSSWSWTRHHHLCSTSSWLFSSPLLLVEVLRRSVQTKVATICVYHGIVPWLLLHSTCPSYSEGRWGQNRWLDCWWWLLAQRSPDRSSGFFWMREKSASGGLSSFSCLFFSLSHLILGRSLGNSLASLWRCRHTPRWSVLAAEAYCPCRSAYSWKWCFFMKTSSGQQSYTIEDLACPSLFL